MPASMTDPAVGASTCASGSHVWKGHIGTLMAKPRAKAKKSKTCIEPIGMTEPSACMNIMLKVPEPVLCAMVALWLSIASAASLPATSAFVAGVIALTSDASCVRKYIFIIPSRSPTEPASV